MLPRLKQQQQLHGVEGTRTALTGRAPATRRPRPDVEQAATPERRLQELAGEQLAITRRGSRACPRHPDLKYPSGVDQRQVAGALPYDTEVARGRASPAGGASG